MSGEQEITLQIEWLGPWDELMRLTFEHDVWVMRISPRWPVLRVRGTAYHMEKFFAVFTPEMSWDEAQAYHNIG